MLQFIKKFRLIQDVYDIQNNTVNPSNLYQIIQSRLNNGEVVPYQKIRKYEAYWVTKMEDYYILLSNIYALWKFLVYK